MQSAAYFHSQSQNFRIKIGEDVTFPCHVNNRGNKDKDPQFFLINGRSLPIRNIPIKIGFRLRSD